MLILVKAMFLLISINQDLAADTTAEHVAFCHNDLQYGNVMQEESSGRCTLIDFEYSGYNPVYCAYRVEVCGLGV